MAVRILGPESPARFALETALCIDGIGATSTDESAKVTVALPGACNEIQGSCIYFGEVSIRIARQFGVEHMERREDSLVRFTCRAPFWSEHELDVLDRFASREVEVPCAGRVVPVLLSATTTPLETVLSDSEGNPLLLRYGDAYWCTLNVPESLSILLGERYVPELSSGAGGWLATWRPLQQAYYRTPRRLRSKLQQAAIRKLEKKLEQWPSDRFSSTYPVDATGWLLIRLIANLIRMVGGPLPTMDAWPDGFRACIVVTHDIEPSRYSYRRGLPRLLNWLESRRTAPHTINPVASYARQYPTVFKHAEIGHHEVGCHGWLHDGRKTRLPRERMIERIARAKTTIESLIGSRVTSFRSPRLDRNDLLYEALDACGFTCDSTVPDVDRENSDRWGGGCSLNFPFHPVVRQGAGWQQLNLLECPVTAPDCAMPVFSGCTEQETLALYALKLDWVEAIGGCYVAIFHGGVFDREDAGLRERLLAGFYDLIATRPVWRATLVEIERWWRAREKRLRAERAQGAYNTRATDQL